jgi:hypothetical protein
MLIVGRPCPQCDAPLAQGAKYCSRCGWSEYPHARERMVWGGILLFLGVPLLVVGGCYLVMVDVQSGGPAAPPGALALAFLLVGWMIWMFLRTFRK